MNLILLSDGIKTDAIRSAILHALTRDVTKMQVLMISYTPPEYLPYLEVALAELRSIGFESIHVHNMATNAILDTSAKYDLLFVCGGNTFTILHMIRQQKIREYLIGLVRGGALYVGVSAGSIIAGPSIEIAGIGEGGDTNEIGMTDFTGFGLTNTIILPHYVLEQELDTKEFEKQYEVEVMRLPDLKAVMVTGDEKYIL